MSDPTATDVRYGHSLTTTYLSLFQVHHLSALRCHRSLCKALRHFPNCSDLWGVLGEIVLSGVSPPIPAAFRIEERVSRNLRKEDDETIRVGPPRKTGTFNKSLAYLIPILLATV